MNNWRPIVYHKQEEFKNKPEWSGIEKVIKKRDKHTCVSCGIKIGLTVHHIISREKGGKDYPPNLVTLCKYCHNEIEPLGFVHILQIKDFKKKRSYIKRKKNEVSEKATRWQQWVYGGYKRISINE